MSQAPTTPFTDPAEDLRLVEAARTGSMVALDTLVRRHQPWVYNLALRMMWRRESAEDAAQEILLKVVTHLGSFEGRSRFSTWLYRIAVNHLLNVRKSAMEEQRMSFADMARSLDECVASDLPDESALPIGHGLLVEEAKLGSITAMLMCLDRRQRLAFILGEVFGVDSTVGGEVMEISAENFRQLLARARRDLCQFMHEKCGLVGSIQWGHDLTFDTARRNCPGIGTASQAVTEDNLADAGGLGHVEALGRPSVRTIRRSRALNIDFLASPKVSEDARGSCRPIDRAAIAGRR